MCVARFTFCPKVHQVLAIIYVGMSVGDIQRYRYISGCLRGWVDAHSMYEAEMSLRVRLCGAVWEGGAVQRESDA